MIQLNMKAGTMNVPAIVSTMKYEESFAASIFELIEKYPDASDQEIIQRLKEENC